MEYFDIHKKDLDSGISSNSISRIYGTRRSMAYSQKRSLVLQHYSSFTDFRNKISQYFRTKRFNLDMRNYLVGGE